MEAYAVPFVEDLTYLFDEKRVLQGKCRLSIENVGRVKTSVLPSNGGPVVERNGFEYYGKGHFADLYDAHLALLTESAFERPVDVKSKRIVSHGMREIVIADNRSFSFTRPPSMEILCPAVPPLAVIGCNQLWMTGHGAPSAGKVHFQAASLIATGEYGIKPYQYLRNEFPTPASAESLIQVATVLSRDAACHVEAVYGFGGAIDLVVGETGVDDAGSYEHSDTD